MTSMLSFLKTHNPICPVHFAGFESDTLRLQRAGWQLSMEQQFDRATMRLAMRHEAARIYAITHEVTYQQMAYLSRGGFSQAPGVEFNVAWVGNDGRFQVFPNRGPLLFQAVDAVPSFQEMTEVKFEDAIPFKPLNYEAPEIVIAHQSVPELMDMILKMQDPRQAEIRERRRKEAWRAGGPGNQFSEGYRPQADIMAQVITLAG